MKVLVLGASGMLGHMLWLGLERPAYVVGTTRVSPSELLPFQTDRRRLVSGVDATDELALTALLDREVPDVLINCVGVIKQLPQGKSAEECVRLNALLPHVLDRLTTERGVRLIHVSTDCVFSGNAGGYSEASPCDAQDAYGRSKALGEVTESGALTIRTSIIGHEIGRELSLLNWFLAQRGPVQGYEKVIYAGLTTFEVSRLIDDVILPRPELSGLYQAASTPIDKYSLLKLIGEVYEHTIEILPVSEPVNDKSLNASWLSAATGYAPPPWAQMIADLRRFSLSPLSPYKL